MYKVNCLNKISAKGTDLFTSAYTLTENFEEADLALVRSAAMHEMTFPKSLLAIARAGAGVNNIPLDRCADENIVVFNTPGANANAVKELVIAGMLLASRDVVGGINWVQTVKDDETVAKLVEKGKSKFAGTEISGKKLGIIGLGAIGGPLANAALALGMEVYGCDPYLSDEAAKKLDSEVTRVATRKEIFENCDFISVHTPLITSDDPDVNTKGMINKQILDSMKDGVIVLNFARDLLVDDDAMEEALKSGKVRKYVTDFPNARTAGMEGVIAIPHLGASTEEAEDNCAMMAVNQLMDYVENGNIINSVNYPRCTLGEMSSCRLAIRYDASKDIAAAVKAVDGIGVTKEADGKRGNVGYYLVECASVSESVIDAVKAIDGVINLRVCSL